MPPALLYSPPPLRSLPPLCSLFLSVCCSFPTSAGLSLVYHNYDFSLSCFITSCCFYEPSVKLSALVSHAHTHKHALTAKGGVWSGRRYGATLRTARTHVSHTHNHLPGFYFSPDKQLQQTPGTGSARKVGWEKITERCVENKVQGRVVWGVGVCHHAFWSFQ